MCIGRRDLWVPWGGSECLPYQNEVLVCRASQALELVEIKHDKDVGTFISDVKHVLVRSLLYVKLIPISPQLNKSSHVCSFITLTCDNLYDTQVPETQDDQFHERVDVGGKQDVVFHN